jgi:hypothetical protein
MDENVKKLIEICSKETSRDQQQKRENAMSDLRKLYTEEKVRELTGWCRMTIAKFCKSAENRKRLEFHFPPAQQAGRDLIDSPTGLDG